MGHLWQDRFKSWYVFDEKYLYTLFRYPEHNPLKAHIVDRVGVYPFSFVYDKFHGKLKECMQESFVLRWFSDSAMLLQSLGVASDEEERRHIREFQKKAVKFKSAPQSVSGRKTLEEYFCDGMTKSERNRAIQKAVTDGFAQSEVARHLHLIDAAISKVLKKLKVKP